MNAPAGWTVEAACARPENSGLPWIADAGDASPREIADMAGVCRSCPVRLACGAYVALGRGTDDEITAAFWAGKQRDHVVIPDLVAMPSAGVQGTLPGLDLVLVGVAA